MIFCFWGKQWYPLSNRCVLDLCKQNLGIQQSFYQDARPRHVMGWEWRSREDSIPDLDLKRSLFGIEKVCAHFFVSTCRYLKGCFPICFFWFCTTVVTSLDGLCLLLTFVCTRLYSLLKFVSNTGRKITRNSSTASKIPFLKFRKNLFFVQSFPDVQYLSKWIECWLLSFSNDSSNSSF